MHRSLCICALLPRLETRTRVVLLLHQLEAPKPTNTGVVAARCLSNSAIVYRGRPPGTDGRQECSPGDGSVDDQVARLAALIPAGTRAAFLFPHATATPIEEWRDAGSTPLTLIVPDGTWRQAGRARSRLGAARVLPCVSLTGARASGSRLRTAKSPERLATIEALAFALGVLEGPEVEAALLYVFRVMADRTLWTNGRVARDAVTGGVPADARSHDPLGAQGALTRQGRAPVGAGHGDF
jgi:DTW domain-containing protein YfiP